ncbi:hypothetical protein BJY59DRAFT_12379 [Rhodotorula toruloides]
MRVRLLVDCGSVRSSVLPAHAAKGSVRSLCRLGRRVTLLRRCWGCRLTVPRRRRGETGGSLGIALEERRDAAANRPADGFQLDVPRLLLLPREHNLHLHARRVVLSARVTLKLEYSRQRSEPQFFQLDIAREGDLVVVVIGVGECDGRDGELKASRDFLREGGPGWAGGEREEARYWLGLCVVRDLEDHVGHRVAQANCATKGRKKEREQAARRDLQEQVTDRAEPQGHSAGSPLERCVARRRVVRSTSAVKRPRRLRR